MDHVIPLSKGGRTNWENIVVACHHCNERKGNRVERPKSMPFKPDYWELVAKRKQLEFDIKHPVWEKYL